MRLISKDMYALDRETVSDFPEPYDYISLSIYKSIYLTIIFVILFQTLLIITHFPIRNSVSLSLTLFHFCYINMCLNHFLTFTKTNYCFTNFCTLFRVHFELDCAIEKHKFIARKTSPDHKEYFGLIII